ncbi:hypothetical protein VCHA47P369_10170 [Vibrio chagasii]|jgi:hypothetical protein|nr:hypothetical protein VCHA36P161_120069 [Vibrio chagasii]CAH6844443.1 hypothetical protein VCHA36P164_10247 [Vibrio chagasii]CAH6856894.1 hypothetical protein VCHA32O87_10391 [Vibrio chagasii]CAH6879681.1 hypothetical protein VCHA34P116_280015 [Vibrio chagasii]CAH6894748.1 hypothetical protein VCHA34P120_20102 [Vibrio chagasii]
MGKEVKGDNQLIYRAQSSLLNICGLIERFLGRVEIKTAPFVGPKSCIWLSKT